MSNASTESLRPLTSAARLLASHGGALPPAVDDARRLFLDLTRQRPAEPDLRAIGAKALDESPTAAAEDLAGARVAIEVHRASLDVAASRALRALIDNADAVTSAVLASSLLHEAAEELAAVAPTVRPDVPRNPPAGSSEDEIIGASRLRRAEGIIESAATNLAAIPALGVYFDPDLFGLLWLDASGVSDPSALGKALRGVRRGFVASSAMTYSPTVDGPVSDQSWHGIVSAAAAAVPGVRFGLVQSLDEYDARVASLDAALAEWRGRRAARRSSAGDDSRGALVL